MKKILYVKILITLVITFCFITAEAQFFQKGEKLLASDTIGKPTQAVVAISADGRTAIVGGASDNKSEGAAWIYVRTADGFWVQQGPKLVANNSISDDSDYYSSVRQGASVSISGNGNTVIVGGNQDSFARGAAWIYTRSNDGTWSQVKKLVGTGGDPNANQGTAVSLSKDGKTAMVGAMIDGPNSEGAVWVFILNNNGEWVQQGPKLVGKGASGAASQGNSVSLSADGNTAIVGGYRDKNDRGASWIFQRDASGKWKQQGPKLVGTNSVDKPNQGISVAMSGDGKTAMVGGYYDNNYYGAVWVFTYINGAWIQQGEKLVAYQPINQTTFGSSVGLSSDGNIAIIGCNYDYFGIGSARIYTRNNDGVWSQKGLPLIGTGAKGQGYQGYYVALSGNGKIAMSGAPADDNRTGAVWVFEESSPLPISFISINATSSQNQVQVTWKVSLETDIFIYEVERKNEENDFVKMGDVTANGHNVYTWNDISPLPGDAFYRVKSINKSGEFRYTDIAKVTSADSKGTFSVAPNPVTNNHFRIWFKNQPKGQYDLQVTNVSGRVLITEHIKHPGGSALLNIPLPSNVLTGIYQLTIIANGKISYSEKVIVNK